LVIVSHNEDITLTYKQKTKRTNANLAEYFKITRRSRDIIMVRLADILGTKQATVGKIELSNKRVEIAEFVYYCIALGRDPVKESRQVASF